MYAIHPSGLIPIIYDQDEPKCEYITPTCQRLSGNHNSTPVDVTQT